MNAPPTLSAPRLILVNLEPYEIMGTVLDFDPEGGSGVESGWGRMLIEEQDGQGGQGGDSAVVEYAYPLAVPVRVGMQISGLLATADGTYAISELAVVPEIVHAQPSFEVPEFEAAASSVLRISRPRRLPSSAQAGSYAAGSNGEQLELVAC